MRYRQSDALGVMKKEFTFGPEKLEHSTSHGPKGLTFSIPYEAIPIDCSEFEASSRLLRGYLLYLWALCNFGVYSIVKAAVDGSSNLIWIAPVGGSLIVAVFIAVLDHLGTLRGTMFKTNVGVIEILGDKNHDEILRRITELRYIRVREKLARVDALADPQREIRKFRWLRENEFISQQEFDSVLETIASNRSARPSPPAAPPQ
jgi:hypothetical protein